MRNSPPLGRPPVGLTAGSLAACLGLALLAGSHLGVAQQLTHLLARLWLPTLLVSLALTALALLVFVLVPNQEAPGSEPTAEEPLLPDPSLPVLHRPWPLLSFHALEPGAGASTLAFNLAVLLACEGRIGEPARRPRPLCLLSSGRLATRLGLDQGLLAAHLAARPFGLGSEVFELALHHSSGCELLCLPETGLRGAQLSRLLTAARALYDVVLLDCPQDRWLREAAVEAGDLVVLVAVLTLASTSAAAAWADGAWRGGWAGRCVLAVNRCGAGLSMPPALRAGFLHHLHLPESEAVEIADSRGLPWSLDPMSEIARQLAHLGNAVLPALSGGEAHNAA